MSKFSLANFGDLLIADFPELDEEFKEFAGLPYIQMGALARLVQQAKGRADWQRYGKAMKIADELWAGADDDLRNALNVSFLEHIDFEGPRGSHAWSLLSQTLQNAWTAMAAYNERLHSALKKKSRDRRR